MWSKKIIIFHFLLEFHGLEYPSLSIVEGTNLTRFQVLEISHINSFAFPHLLQQLLFHATFLQFLVLFVFFSNWLIGAYKTNECKQAPTRLYNTDFVFCILYKENMYWLPHDKLLV